MVHDPEDLRKLDAKAFYRGFEEFVEESGDISGYEVKMAKRSTSDSKPVHVAVAILQWSKILFIKYDPYHVTLIMNYFSFMEFLYTHLERGSFQPAYADTDSMCLGLSKSVTPKDDSMESYYRLITHSLWPITVTLGQSLIPLFDQICENHGRQSGSHGLSLLIV